MAPERGVSRLGFITFTAEATSPPAEKSYVHLIRETFEADSRSKLDRKQLGEPKQTTVRLTQGGAKTTRSGEEAEILPNL